MDEKNINFSPEQLSCPLSDPTNLHLVNRRNHFLYSGHHYFCNTCDLKFTEENLFPPEIKHPFHLLHPLTLINPKCQYKSPEIPDFGIPFSGDVDEDKEDAGSNEDKEDVGSDENHQKCKFCRDNIDEAKAYYHCSICNFSLHIQCSVDKPPLTIENPKTHDHALTLLPRRVPFPCDACGFSLSNLFSQVYSCLLCNYWVHKSCIYLPRVIKITRHRHRVSYTSSARPTRDHLRCGVCRRSVDVNYGHYSCNKGCHYAFHSQCATRTDVWDGKDLEGVPEEDEEEDIEPFVRIDEKTIQHFSHKQHHLRLEENYDNRDDNKCCQACTLAITVSDRFYSCMKCDFVLHEHCAGLSRKIDHPSHKHPLTLLYPISHDSYESGAGDCFTLIVICGGCHRRVYGFIYKCMENPSCFVLDVMCASLSDPSSHDVHEHPLFFNLTKGTCKGCESNKCSPMYLECIECNFFLGLKCATVPSVAHYKHDRHPLTLCCRERKTTCMSTYWCEICETKLDATKWFYTCESCLITLHVACLLDADVYLKPNHAIDTGNGVFLVYFVHNGNVRPMCDTCGIRCVKPLVVKWLTTDKSERNSCSWICFRQGFYFCLSG